MHEKMIPFLLFVASTERDPVRDMLTTRNSFERMFDAYEDYTRRLREIVPIYDVAAIPGPPFDMFYHLEVVDRLRPNLTEILDAMRDEWQFLDGMET